MAVAHGPSARPSAPAGAPLSDLVAHDARDFCEDDMVQHLEERQQTVGCCPAALRGARGSERNQSDG
ncbi:hypothetical protein QR97_38335 [Streptomyces sp. PBH53]|uniref:hypothetical protein n=1 Tax=Streptomyces sp. PBH53 TaxID=1577075 RepID=UPI000656606A|nr:hypothetical protein [Streptomyces sp. PBH53]AKN74796.1 hypothetical protein QR97_38335 [Streptomyces sp. PBH53]